MAWSKLAKPARSVRHKKLFVEPLEDRTLLAAGFLDPTFGTGGKMLTSFAGSDDEALASTLQPDGKIVVAGFTTPASGGQDFALARYNANGTLDNSFGVNGKITTDFFGGNDEALGVAVQPDGRIVAAGFASTPTLQVKFALARYLANGSLDPNFGTGGRVTTSIGGSLDEATSVKLQPDGFIVVAGIATNLGNQDFAVARYDINGNLDAKFGSSGITTTDFSMGTDAAHAMLIQPDGKIVLAGSSNQGPNTVFGLARYDTQGNLDLSFGAAGKVTTNLAGQSDIANAVAIQSDGKLVVAGSTKVGGFLDFAVVRYTSDGKVDSSFGTGGKVATDFAGQDDRALGVVVQPDGKIIAGGSATVNGTLDVGLARYTDTGSLDGTFGTNGTATTDFGGGLNGASSLLLATDRTVTAAGFALQAGAKEFALVRYLGDPVQAGQLDPTFGLSGEVHFQFGTGTETDALNDMALQTDGRIVAVGSTKARTGSVAQFGVARFNTDGSADASFGVNGGTVTGFGASNDGVASGVAIHNGMIVVAGSFNSGRHIALARYRADGILDTSFGSQGEVTTNFTPKEYANSVAVQADGKILVAGAAQTSPNNSAFLLARFTPDGSLDGSFGFGGFVTTDLGPSDAAANRIVLQPDGKIVAVGHTSTSGGNFHFAVLRYTADGNLDLTFNGTGEVLTSFPEGGSPPLGADARGVTLPPDSKIVVAGSFLGQDSLSQLVVARFNPDGSPDATFNGTGHVTFKGVLNVAANDVAIQANGKVVAAGVDAEPGGANFLLQRYNPNGTLDPTFGNNGTVITNVAPNDSSQANRILVQSDDKLLAAGTSGGKTLRQFGLVRYFADLVGPQASAGGVYTVPEGGKVQLDGSGSTGAGLKYAWDLNGNGIYGETGPAATRGDEEGVTPTFIASGLDAPLAYKVRLRVKDEQSLTNYATATILITEAPPVVSIAGAASVNEGTAYTLNLSAVDPGPDAFTSWTINWGDGTIQTVAGNPPSVAHIFTNEASGVPVSASVTNADGMFASGNTVTVAVVLVPPTLAISGSNIADQGEVYTLNLSAAEPGQDTIANWTITWGDGKSDTVPGISATATHIYGFVTANFTISATATDGDGTYSANSIVVAISQLPLTLSLVGANFNLPGTLYTLHPTSNKPLTNTITSWSINWGDGNIQNFPKNPDTVTHTYVALCNNYTISGTATDTTGTHAAGNTISLSADFPTQNQCFIAQLYIDMLGRPVDHFGLPAWSGYLDAGGRRAQVVLGIENSPEYRTNQIDNAYSSLLGRAADPNGLVSFLEFMQVGGTIEQVRAAIIGSQEYFAKAGGNDDLYLRAVYHDVLGRAIDADGAVAWQHGLNIGFLRQQVADLIIRSEEGSDIRVQSLYQQYLRRPADPQGLSGFATALEHGFAEEQVIILLASSPEYFVNV